MGLLDNLGQLGRATRDGAVALLAQTWINHRIRFGRMTQLQIDPEARTMRAHLELKGESSPLDIDVDAYELEKDGAKTYLTIKRIRTSREWLTLLAEQFVLGRRLEVPGFLEAAL